MSMNAIDRVTTEFGEWLADRLPEMIMPTKERAVLDAAEALTAILRKHFAEPAERPATAGERTAMLDYLDKFLPRKLGTTEVIEIADKAAEIFGDSKVSPSGLDRHYKQAAHEIGELFCWCVENLEKFPPAPGVEWIDDVKRRLKAITEPAERADQWQPIATAPKDGTHILACRNACDITDVSVVRWDELASGGWMCMADGFRAIAAQGDFGTDYQEITPTHWMPLPLPPQEQARG